jgi:membrane protein
MIGARRGQDGVMASADPDPGPRLDETAAGRPFDLPLRSLWPTLKRTGREFLDDNLLQWAAALTFFAVLSLFPAMLALVSVLGLVGTPALEPLIDNVAELAPGAARDITLDALRNIEQAGGGAGIAFVVGLLAALWSSSGYVGAFIPAANVVWEVQEARPLGPKLALRVALTVVLLVLIALTALTVVLTGPIARELGAVVGLGDTALLAWSIAKWPFLGGVVMLLLGILYWASPNVRHPGWSWVTPGSVLAVALWIVASLGFTLYVNTFASFNATYGSIGGVLVFLLWLWLANIAVLLGAELNAELARTRAIEAGMRPEDRTPFLPPRSAEA